MARISPKRTGTGKRAIGPRTRFAPDLLALEDRSVPALIYVDLAFTGTDGAAPDQAFNAGGTGPLGTVAASGLTFVAPGDPSGLISGGTDGRFAVSDITTAFNAARDNPGPDTILLAPGVYLLENGEGQSATLNPGVGSNDNTYFFNSDPLSILGSGSDASVIQPITSTFDPTELATLSDPVFAVRDGADFIGSDFRFDGSQAAIGVGIGVSGGTDVTLTRVDIRNFVAQSGAGTNGATFGFGVAVNPNAGGFVSVVDSLFSGNARVGVSFLNANGQVSGSTFTGKGAGDLADIGVQALGTSNVYVSGSTFTSYLGAAGNGEESAALVAAQDVDPDTGVPVPGGARLIAVGNSITGNSFGVVVGTIGVTADTSVALVNFNDLSGNVVGLDATAALAGAGVRTGIDAGIDGRNNFFGGTGPNRQASTGSVGDALINPAGTGSKADGNVSIGLFRPVTVPTTAVDNPTFVADPAGSAALAKARADFLGAGVALKIYVNGTADQFTGTAGSPPDQDFNPSGTGPLGTVAAGGLTFVAAGTPFGPGGVTDAGSYAVPDLTTAFGLARDNPGADIIFLAASDTPFALDNSQGASTQAGGFNDNTYFFNASPLSLLGSGKAASVVTPTAGTYDPADPDTLFDPVFAVRQGSDFVGSDFAFDGSAAKFGGGIGVSGGTDATLTNVSLTNFVGETGAGTQGASSGYGLFANGNTGGFVSVATSSFSGIGRIGVGLFDADAQILGSTFTGRGAGDLVDYAVQATGTANVFLSGNTLTGYLGQASGDATQSAAVLIAQDVDPDTGVVAPGGVSLLAAGNVITGNTNGVVLGTPATIGDTSKAVVQYNDLSNNVIGLDATFALGSGTTGVDSGIDGRFNFFGGTGPDRQATNPANGQPNDTGAIGDEQLNPTGTGSQANGNVNINSFSGVTVPPTTVPGVTFGTDGGQTLAEGAAVVQAFFAPSAPATLIIYVDPTFAGSTPGGAPNSPFNPTGVGQPTVAAAGLTFLAANTMYGSAEAPAGVSKSYAVADITTAFDLARANPGADTILLAASPTPYDLFNGNGGSLSGNTYFFSGAANTLTIGGSGIGNSVIRPTVSTYDGTGVTAFDPVFAVQNGATLTASDFAFDGALAKFGGGIGVSGATAPTNATLTNVALRNFVGETGAGAGGASSGYGLFVNPNAGGLVTIRGSQFSGNGRFGVGFVGDDTGAANGQVFTSTFTGRGAGDLVDYGVQAQGQSQVYVTGSVFSGYLGRASVDGTESAALSVVQGTNSDGVTPFAGGAALLAVGNSITGGRIGVSAQNATAAGTATADVRFNDLSSNLRAIDATTVGATVNAPNNFFGGTAAQGFTDKAPVAGAVTGTTVFRTVTAPTLDVASEFARGGGATLASAAGAAATAYVTDPRIQSDVFLTGATPAAGQPLVVTINFAEPLARNAAGTAYLFDPSLVSVAFTINGVSTPLTAAQFTVTPPDAAGTGRTATVTVPAATLATLGGGASGTITVTVAPSSGTADTGNLQLTASGNQTGGPNALTVAVGAANTGVTLTPIGNLTFNTNGPAQTVGTTVTYSPGRTGTVTFSVSPNNLVTVTQGGTSTSPTFTVTPVAGAIGSGVVTVTATDSDGVSNSTAFGVQVGTGTSPTISRLPDQTIPFNGSTGPLTVNVAGANAPLTVTASTSNPGVATVSVTGTGGTRTVVVTANPALTTGGSTAVTLRVTDAQGISTVESFNVTVAPQRVRLIAVGSGPGSAPVVQVYGQDGVKLFGFTAFELSFTGGVSVATGDVNGDGVDDIVAGASIGGGPRVRVIDGKTGAEIANFFAFESSNRNGVYVAVGKLVSAGNAANASGYFREQIIVGAGDGGGPRVSAFDVLPGQGATPTRIANFFAFEDTFRNGVTVAAGDLTGDGVAEIVTGSGFGGGPRVRAFTAAGAPAGVDFFAFDSAYRGGVNVAAGPLDASGRASIVAGVGPDGGSLVRVFSNTGTQSAQFQAYPDAATTGVRVGTGQFTAAGPESILTGPSVGGGPLVKVFSGSNPGAGAVFSDFAFEAPFRGGIFVG